MLQAQELRELIQASRDEIKAVVAVATDEKRELTDDEQKLVDEKLAAIASHEKSLESRVKIDDQLKAQAAAKLAPQIDQQLDDRNNADAPTALDRVKIPAKAKCHRKLSAYENERDAYIAGHLILGGLMGRPQSRQFCIDHGLVLGSMVTKDNSLGGFVTTDEMQTAMIRLREERGVFPRYANGIPMGADIITIPRMLADVTAYWAGEGAEITASDATLGQAELMARKLACLTKVSSELDEDAVVDVGDMITTSMAYSMADKIDEAAFNGDGTSTYGGVLGLKNALNASAINDAISGNVGASTLDLVDFEATVGTYPQYPGASPVWFVHSAVFWASMARLQNAAGGNAVNDLGNGPVMQFMGYPVQFTQVLPSTTGTSASTILAYFGDLRLGASYGTRRSMRTEVSVDRYFENDLIGIKCTERIAINIHERGDTIRTRPIVALKTAAS